MEKIPLNLSSINEQKIFLTAVLYYIWENFPEIHSISFLSSVVSNFEENVYSS